MRRWVSAVGIVLAIALLGGAVALAAALDDSSPAAGEQGRPEDSGLPPFLTGDQEMPPGLAKKDALPPGLAKKLDANTPRGLAKKGDGWLPPGLAKKGKIPPGHAKRLGVDPVPGTNDGS